MPKYGPRTFVAEDVPFYFGGDARILYDGTNNELTFQTDDSGDNWTDRVRIAANVDITSVEFYNDDPGAAGIRLDAYHESASPAANDVLLNLRVYGDDSGGIKTQYAGIQFIAGVVGDPSEDGIMKLQVALANTLRDGIELNATNLTIVFDPDFDGSDEYIMRTDRFGGADTGGPAMLPEVASATNPVWSYVGDDNSGLGRQAAGAPSMIADGTEVMRFTTTAAYAPIGVRIGADSGDNEIDDASQGSASTQLFIGNSSIDVTVSDERVKTSVTMPNGLSRKHLSLLASALREYEYTAGQAGWIGNRYVGHLAQNLWDVLPEYVIRPEDEQSNWSVKYNYMVGPLIWGWDDHESRIAALEKEILVHG